MNQEIVKDSWIHGEDPSSPLAEALVVQVNKQLKQTEASKQMRMSDEFSPSIITEAKKELWKSCSKPSSACHYLPFNGNHSSVFPDHSSHGADYDFQWRGGSAAPLGDKTRSDRIEKGGAAIHPSFLPGLLNSNMLNNKIRGKKNQDLLFQEDSSAVLGGSFDRSNFSSMSSTEIKYERVNTNKNTIDSSEDAYDGAFRVVQDPQEHRLLHDTRQLKTNSRLRSRLNISREDVLMARPSSPRSLSVISHGNPQRLAVSISPNDEYVNPVPPSFKMLPITKSVALTDCWRDGPHSALPQLQDKQSKSTLVASPTPYSSPNCLFPRLSSNRVQKASSSANALNPVFSSDKNLSGGGELGSTSLSLSAASLVERFNLDPSQRPAGRRANRGACR